MFGASAQKVRGPLTYVDAMKLEEMLPLLYESEEILRHEDKWALIDPTSAGYFYYLVHFCNLERYSRGISIRLEDNCKLTCDICSFSPPKVLEDLLRMLSL